MSSTEELDLLSSRDSKLEMIESAELKTLKDNEALDILCDYKQPLPSSQTMN